MKIGALATNAYARQADQAERSSPLRQSQQAERQAPRAEARVEKKEELPKPVANAQGQTTGQVISVTA